MSIKQIRNLIIAAATLGFAVAAPTFSAEASAPRPEQAEETISEDNMCSAGDLEAEADVSDDAVFASCTPFDCVCPKGYYKHCVISGGGVITCSCKPFVISG